MQKSLVEMGKCVDVSPREKCCEKASINGAAVEATASQKGMEGKNHCVPNWKNFDRRKQETGSPSCSYAVATEGNGGGESDGNGARSTLNANGLGAALVG